MICALGEWAQKVTCPVSNSTCPWQPDRIFVSPSCERFLCHGFKSRFLYLFSNSTCQWLTSPVVDSVILTRKPFVYISVCIKWKRTRSWKVVIIWRRAWFSWGKVLPSFVFLQKMWNVAHQVSVIKNTKLDKNGQFSSLSQGVEWTKSGYRCGRKIQNFEPRPWLSKRCTPLSSG